MDWRHHPNLALYLPLGELDGTSFMSRDAYGHLCVVTGAKFQTGRGRVFAGGTDVITLPASVANFSAVSAPGVDRAFSIGVWVNTTLADTSGGILSKGTANKYEWDISSDNTGAGAIFARFWSPTAGSHIGRSAPTGSSWDVTWKNIIITYSGSEASSGVKIYANSVRIDNADNEDLVPAYTVMTDNGSSVYIGKTWDGGNTMTGTIGEVWIFNRALTPLEIQQIYMDTKDKNRG